jgi:hypothetical protein
MARVSSSIVGFMRSSSSSRSWRREAHGAKGSFSSWTRPCSFHSFFFRRWPSFIARACRWFIIRVRILSGIRKGSFARVDCTFFATNTLDSLQPCAPSLMGIKLQGETVRGGPRLEFGENALNPGSPSNEDCFSSSAGFLPRPVFEARRGAGALTNPFGPCAGG